MLIELNKEIIEKLSKTELDIIRYINQNEKKLSELSIVDIGFDTFSSPSTVSRAIRKCGVSGFNELRYLTTVKAQKDEVQNMGEVINKSLIETQRVIEMISVPKILKIVKAIRNSKRILVLGRGLTEYVAEEFTLKLQLLDYDAMFIRDPNIMRIKTKTLDHNHVVIAFSLNGYTEELIDSLRNANQAGAKNITCSCNADSPLVPLSDFVVLGYKDSEVAIEGYEVDSRLPLHIISRIIIEYMVSYKR